MRFFWFFCLSSSRELQIERQTKKESNTSLTSFAPPPLRRSSPDPTTPRTYTHARTNTQIARRRRAHAESRPDAKIISLGIGDTTEPIPPFIAAAMRDAAAGLGTQSGYSGYGAEQGRPELRKAVCDRFYASCGLVPEEVFISDGSKCDIGRLQMMFGKGVSVALQDPAYPVCVFPSLSSTCFSLFFLSRLVPLCAASCWSHLEKNALFFLSNLRLSLDMILKKTATSTPRSSWA